LFCTSEQELKRVRGIFELFDADKSGFIDVSEFQALAAQCGIYLSTDAVAKQVAQINANVSRLSFDEFFAWIESRDSADIVQDTEEQNMSALKLQLQSSALVRSAAALTRSLTTQFAANSGRIAASELFQIKISTDTVEFENARTAVCVEYYNDAARATSFLEACDCVGTPLVIAVDFNLRSDATDEAVGELAGLVSPLLEMAPLPFPVEPVFSMPEEYGAERVLRLTLKVELDPIGIVSDALPGVDIAGLIQKLQFKVESSADLLDLSTFDQSQVQDFQDFAAKIAPHFKYRVALDVAIQQSLMHVLMQTIPELSPTDKIGLVAMKTFKDLELNIKTFDASTLLTGESAMSDLFPVLLTGPVAIASLAQSASQMTPDVLASMTGAEEPFQSLLKAVATNLVGVRKVLVQNQSAGVELSLKGLDLLALLPKQ
jgi:hypothetical protein